MAEADISVESQYQSLHILDSSHIAEGSGFENHNQWREYYGISGEMLDRYIVKALQDPEWLIIPKYSDEHQRLEDENLPRAQYVDFYTVEAIKEMQFLPEETQKQIAEKVRTNTQKFPSGMASIDVIMRAYELLAKDYPNTTLFRGASFDPIFGYTGIDFAPADLPTAIYFAKHTTTKTRPYPVIVILPLKDFVTSYLHGEARVGCEGDWDRGSIEVSFIQGRFDRKYPQSLQILRLPTSEEDIEVVLKHFKQSAILQN